MTAADTIEAWRRFLGSPVAPKTALSALELDGYLTGIIVSPEPQPIMPSAWLPGLWGGDEPIFDDIEQVNVALTAVMAHYNAIIADIDRSLERLQADRVSDYRPLFLTSDAKPSHGDVRAWVRGFMKAMALTPAAWTALAEDERTQVLIHPFVGFVELDDAEPFEMREDADECLDADAALIPRTITVLRKIAQMRFEEAAASAPLRRAKVGRNDPCPCGSGKKYKRCCGAN
ncbi:MAG TPA: UPF0149 family protein [Candidatus Sulfotelmatobacter sp.]|nr:UPF0149 family protein [Candidatus Sulfotelmatobacter sp.]